MPALPDVPNTIRVVTTVTDDDDLASINRFFLRYTGAQPNPTELLVTANGCAAQWNTNMAPIFHSSSTLTSVSMEDLTNPSASSVVTSVTHAGTRSGTRLSAAAAAVIAASIPRRYRGGHPRTYLACGVEADLQTRQTWTSAAITAFQTAWLDFIGGTDTFIWTGGGALDPVNVSYYSGFTNFTFPSGRARAIPTLRTTPVVDQIGSYTCRTNVGSQRRRNL